MHKEIHIYTHTHKHTYIYKFKIINGTIALSLKLESLNFFPANLYDSFSIFRSRFSRNEVCSSLLSTLNPKNHIN